MKKSYIDYCSGSNTIRQFPENYLLAHRENNKEWICNPDLAADKDFAILVFVRLLEWENKYTKTGPELLEAIAPKDYTQLVRVSLN